MLILLRNRLATVQPTDLDDRELDHVRRAALLRIPGDWVRTGDWDYVYRKVIPRVLLGSIAGVFVDRWDRRWTMIGANLVSGALLVLLLGLQSAAPG